MVDRPSVAALHAALTRAGQAHHDYETVHLKGVRDEAWAGWYAAHVHGQLGDFIRPSALTSLLEQTQAEGDWAEAAAQAIFAAMDRGN